MIPTPSPNEGHSHNHMSSFKCANQLYNLYNAKRSLDAKRFQRRHMQAPYLEQTGSHWYPACPGMLVSKSSSVSWVCPAQLEFMFQPMFGIPCATANSEAFLILKETATCTLSFAVSSTFHMFFFFLQAMPRFLLPHGDLFIAHQYRSHEMVHFTFRLLVLVGARREIICDFHLFNLSHAKMLCLTQRLETFRILLDVSGYLGLGTSWDMVRP